MMGKKDYSERSQVQIASLDDLVPSGHLVRKLEEAIDLSFIMTRSKISTNLMAGKALIPLY